MVWFLSIPPVFLLMFGLSSYFVGILCILNCRSPGQLSGWPFFRFIFWFRVSWTWWWCKNSHKRLFLLNKRGRGDRCFIFWFAHFFSSPFSLRVWFFESQLHASVLVLSVWCIQFQILDSRSWKTVKSHFVLRVARVLVPTYHLYFHRTLHFCSFILFRHIITYTFLKYLFSILYRISGCFIAWSVSVFSVGGDTDVCKQSVGILLYRR